MFTNYQPDCATSRMFQSMSENLAMPLKRTDMELACCGGFLKDRVL